MSEQSPSLIQERQGNREVPFPEASIEGKGDLENSLLQGNLDYDNLPPTLSSIGIEVYGNWLAQLTQGDPQHRERAAFIHLRIDNEEFIYPSNPNIGELTSSMAAYSRKPKKFIPLVRVHSHPLSSSFSPQDLRRAMQAGGLLHEDNDFIAELVATQERNYLLLKTEQTVFENNDLVEQKMKEAENSRQTQENQVIDLLANVSKEIGIPESEQDQLLVYFIQAQVELIGSDSITYINTLKLTNEITKEQKIAFYASDKDDIYKLVSDSDVKATIEKTKEFRRQALKKAIAKLIGTTPK